MLKTEHFFSVLGGSPDRGFLSPGGHSLPWTQVLSGIWQLGNSIRSVYCIFVIFLHICFIGNCLMAYSILVWFCFVLLKFVDLEKNYNIEFLLLSFV